MSQPNHRSIVDMANAAFAIAPQHRIDNDTDATMSLDDRLDAARAILGISPSSVTVNAFDKIHSFGGRFGKPIATSSTTEAVNCQNEASSPTTTATLVPHRRPRSNSAGLDALAFLATREQEANEALGVAGNDAQIKQQSVAPIILENRNMGPKVIFVKPLVASAVTSSSDDDSEAMPPPPPRAIKSRRRSISNPEGMEKWAPIDSQRRFLLVLPASILEEELAEANAAMRAREETSGISRKAEASTTTDSSLSGADGDARDVDRKSEDDDQDLSQDELLRRARSRLLEDLSEGNLNGDKGVLTLPHTLAKYKEVYNRNGRIGIYTPGERAAIIARFQGKRSRRVWNKKIRYNCRKNLADRRLRVKGRFVKRTSGQVQPNDSEGEGDEYGPLTNSIPSIAESEVDESVICNEDAEMPDVSDPDAGFCPTDDQPYRRLRRHTIT